MEMLFTEMLGASLRLRRKTSLTYQSNFVKHRDIANFNQ